MHLTRNGEEARDALDHTVELANPQYCIGWALKVFAVMELMNKGVLSGG
jgi:hypothetical protein